MAKKHHEIAVTAYVNLSDVLEDLSNDELLQECKDREIDISSLHKAKPDYDAALADTAYEIDTWLHDLRAAFLARDAVHFDVLLARGEERYLFVEQIATRRVAA